MSRPAKASLAAEILLTYLTTRWYLHRRALPSVVARLRQVEDRPGLPRLGISDGIRLGRAVGKTLSMLPLDSRCLLRSLVLMRLLARRGETPKLVIASRPGGDNGFQAHAWIEVGGQPLLPPASSSYGHLVTL